MHSAILSIALVMSVMNSKAQSTSAPMDSTVQSELSALRAFLAERMGDLDKSASAEGHRVIARSMEERIVAWRQLVRDTWPDHDNGYSAYIINSSLANSVGCSQPGLSAFYQFMATQALLNHKDPYRPMPYTALGHMQEFLFSLSRAKNPERIQRLRTKVSSAYSAVR